MPLFNVATADWDKIYQSADYADTSPWNIGQPQPEFIKLYQAGKLQGAILDAGCGIGVTSVWLAEKGHAVVGFDLSAVAVLQAQKLATENNIRADFAVKDLSSFSGYDAHFDTVVDSAVFHSMPKELREPYMQRLSVALRPGGNFFALVFTTDAFPVVEYGPRTFSEIELRDAASTHLIVDAIQPAKIHLLPPKPGSMPVGFEWREVVIDSSGLAQLPAWLLSAHRK